MAVLIPAPEPDGVSPSDPGPSTTSVDATPGIGDQLGQNRSWAVHGAVQGQASKAQLRLRAPASSGTPPLAPDIRRDLRVGNHG